MRLVCLGSAWLAGIALGLATTFDWWPVALGSALALAFLALLYPEARRSILATLALLVALALGAWRASLSHPAPADLPAGQITAVRGAVVDWPARGDRTASITVAVDAVRVGERWQGGSARVRAYVPLYPVLWRGDRVELRGYYRAAAALPRASTRDALQRRGLHGEFRAFSLQTIEAAVRGDLAGHWGGLVGGIEALLRRQIPRPEAELVAGILLGDALLLPAALRDAFNATGTAHIMALSGWNIALVAGLCQLLGRRLGWARSPLWLLGSAGVLWLYTLLVGGGPTIVRAALMGTLYLLASATGRRGDALTALVAAALVMTAVAPGTLLDCGFQLSCAATAGLILAAGRVARVLRRLPPGLAEGLAATVVAELFTLPLVLHYYGRLATVTLPANLLVEPLVPLVMAGGALTVVAGLASDFLAALCGLATWLPARLLLLLVERLGALPWATISVPAPSWPVVALLYALLGLAVSARVPPGGWRPWLAGVGGRLVALPRPLPAPLIYGLLTGLAAAGWLLLLAG